MAAAVRRCLCFKSLQSLTAAALFGRSKWRERREGVSIWCWGPQGFSDQGVCGLYGCVFSRRFQWDHRQPCPTSAAGYIADLVEVLLAASGTSDQGVWGVYGCIFSSRFQWYHRRPCPTSAAGYITAFSRRRPYRPALTSSHETVHTDPYMCGEGGWFKLAVFSQRWPSLAAVSSSESSFLCQCRPH